MSVITKMYNVVVGTQGDVRTKIQHGDDAAEATCDPVGPPKLRSTNENARVGSVEFGSTLGTPGCIESTEGIGTFPAEMRRWL